MNWLYDHLRFLPRYKPVVLCDTLLNRTEFPQLEVRHVNPRNLGRRAWYRVRGDLLYPPDRRYLSSLTPRLLHSHFGYVAVGDHRLRDSSDLPWVVSFYGADIYELARHAEWRRRYERLFERATIILALGPHMARALAGVDCPRDKIRVHALGIDVRGLPNRRRVVTAGQPLKILFAGTFREKKGVPYLLHALKLLRRSGVAFELHLVGDEGGKLGDTEVKKEIFALIEDLGLREWVTHYGWLQYQQLMQLAIDCHIFVAPSVTAADGDAEGTPFVVQQMMASGMPVVATHHSDVPYIFGKHAGCLIPERDAAAIARRLQRYADEPETVGTDGMALRAHMTAAFDIRIRAAALADLYDAL